ncbi:penicillin-binding protein 1C [Campylobacter sp. MIT 99-7217]|uniref:penicillin-binding protein 1C n=1 Tax=Campylobacter sp. MIT 99-7217 TaxID=535091 RepID=UPI0021AF67B1|nr:penicillin-binding protein 1C [Campylobacter sp. MIT 99-7217]
MKNKFLSRKALKFLKFIGFLGLLFFVYVAFVFFSFDKDEFLDNFEARYSKLMLDRNEEILSVFLNDDEQWHLKASKIPDKLKQAVILYEDKNFYSHFGVDFLALFRAFKNNLFYAKRSGASTISMQVIKLNEKNPRTYFYKFHEIIKAFALEYHFSKDEILSLYLSNAPYGGNLVGYEAALLFYFDKKPDDITNAQAALLAVLPNNPGLINLEKNKTLLKEKRARLLGKMLEKGLISKDLFELSLREDLPSFKPRKNLAPHLALELLNDKQKFIISSIDKNLQSKFEAKAKEFSQKLMQKGIHNLSVLLLDTKSKKALAYVGSQDFYDILNLGQINGIKAKRSVGSTLKPFLFALSIDEGLIAPQSILLDVPTFFSNFNPQNANKKYYGLIPAKEALRRSLNVPFVSLLQAYGYEKFFFKIKDFLGFEDEDYKKYGLSFILGTKELSLEELSKLYLALANYGKMSEISYIRDENLTEQRQIFSKASAFLTLQSLKDLARVGLENFNKKEKIISYKTGTSYGRKDAWAMGATPKYTLGVWVGNFTGEANANLYGVSIAGDLLFELLGLLEDTDLEFEKSEDLIKIRVETKTHYRYDEELGGDFAEILYPKEAKPLRFSPFLKKVFMYENEEINSLHPHFKDAKLNLKLDLPLNALNFLQEQKINVKNQKNLQILYPSSGLNILQAKDFDSKKGLLIKIANLKNEKVFWYLNQRLIYEGSEKSQILDLNADEYELYLISESGEYDFVKFRIEK